MSDIAIRVECLGKKYFLRHQQSSGRRYVALRDVLAEKARAPFRKLFSSFKSQPSALPPQVSGLKPQVSPLPPQVSGLKSQVSPLPPQVSEEEFWALRNVSFEIKQGEAVGIIGRNGAGKSTLLKLLSRITEPTTGRIELDGRVASLLEVGTGFHPELTGRENIYLNGAILGMLRAEITRKFDEIVAFAEVEKFLDTPVKHYSSGMYMRLAFAVAAHLEPDILVVDEVLAVGDVEFQTKCLGKMEEVSKGGRTVLFVSHNLSVVTTLCSRAILLERGSVALIGDAPSVAEHYLKHGKASADTSGFNGLIEDKYAKIYSTYAHQAGMSLGSFENHLPITLGIDMELRADIAGLIVQVRVLGNDGRRLILSNFDDATPEPPGIFKRGRYLFECTIPPDTLSRGSFRAAFWVGLHNRHSVVDDFGQIALQVENTAGIGRWYHAGGDHDNVLRPRLPWQILPKQCAE